LKEEEDADFDEDEEEDDADDGSCCCCLEDDDDDDDDDGPGDDGEGEVADVAVVLAVVEDAEDDAGEYDDRVFEEFVVENPGQPIFEAKFLAFPSLSPVSINKGPLALKTFTTFSALVFGRSSNKKMENSGVRSEDPSPCRGMRPRAVVSWPAEEERDISFKIEGPDVPRLGLNLVRASSTKLGRPRAALQAPGTPCILTSAVTPEPACISWFETDTPSKWEATWERA